MSTIEPIRIDDLFRGGGEMRELCRSFDWSSTPLGPVTSWPQSLRTAVSVALGCAFPSAVRWGPDLIQIYNDPYTLIVGPKHPTGLGRPMREIWPEATEMLTPSLARVLQGETVFFEDTVMPLNRNGIEDEGFFTVSYSPLYNDDGAIAGILTVAVDTTQRVIAERRMQRAQATAEAANRAKAEFLATMSHELRTPLNAIGGYTELIELGVHGPLTDAQRSALMRIQTSQRHLLGVINQVLSYSRLEAGAMDYRNENFDIAESLAVCEALTAPQMREKGLQLVINVPPREVIVNADREKFEQIVLNLFTNAIKFTSEGGIEVSAASNGDVVHIAVKDTGTGIPRDRLENIFEPFVQLDSGLTRTSQGVGLGLAISRDLARGMGGDLTVRSEPGKGATFCIMVPQA